MNIDYILQNHYNFANRKPVGGGARLDTTPPPTISSFVAIPKDSEVIMTWVNPVDTDFVGLKILRQVGVYPTSVTDGTLVYTGTDSTYTDTGLVDGTTYYYRVFTYDWDSNYNTTESGQEANAKPYPIYIYGVKIDTTNSNPLTALTYTDNAVGFTAALGNNGTFVYGSWADKFPFNVIKPCLYLNGAVNYYLDPLDYTLREDGVTASDITSGADGDVMVEFPKIYWKFETISTNLYVRYSNAQVDDTYKCLAHMRGTTEKDNCYISSYLGYSLSSKLRSLSGVLSTVSQNITTFRTLAQANGTGYDQLAYYQLLMLQVLYTVMFKNLDSQTALGQGNTNNSVALATGGTDKKGLFYGETTGKFQNKFCGIEDFFGNTYIFIDGYVMSSTRYMLIANQNFNGTGSGYTQFGGATSGDLSGYPITVQGITNAGFILKTKGASVTTYYCDYNYFCASALVTEYGGNWSSGTASVAGAFCFLSYYSNTSSATSCGSRIMKL